MKHSQWPPATDRATEFPPTTDPHRVAGRWAVTAWSGMIRGHKRHAAEAGPLGGLDSMQPEHHGGWAVCRTTGGLWTDESSLVRMELDGSQRSAMDIQLAEKPYLWLKAQCFVRGGRCARVVCASTDFCGRCTNQVRIFSSTAPCVLTDAHIMLQAVSGDFSCVLDGT